MQGPSRGHSSVADWRKGRGIVLHFAFAAACICPQFAIMLDIEV